MNHAPALKSGIFHLHYNRFHARRNDPETWTVRTRRGNMHARTVECRVPVTTVYRGDSARQPRAYLRGYGQVTRAERGVIVIRSLD